MAKKPKPLADQLRVAVKNAERKGLTRYRIAKEAGIAQSTLTQFMNDPEQQLRLDIAEKIAAAMEKKIMLQDKNNS